MRDQPDPAVIEAVLDGDAEAYSILVRRYRDDFTRFAVRMLGDREDAEEAIQSAFLRGYRALGQCRDHERFGGWLYSIVVNECRTKATRRGNRERRMVRDDALLESLSEEHPSEDMALHAEIEAALLRLEPDQREAFVLKHVEQLSYEEMAEITGAGVSALKMRVKRACERMRESLEEVRHG